MNGEYYTTIGMDVSDRTTKVCVMAKERGARRIVEEATIPTSKESLRTYLSGKSPDWPVVFETGAHCRWMKREVESLGMKAIVANPSKLRMVTESNTKNDRNDARELARIALADVGLLHPVRLRREPCQQALRLLKARDGLVKVRTALVNELRGFAKSMGFRLPDCPANRAHALDKSGWPADFEAVAWPLMDVLETVDLKIRAYESQIRAVVGSPELGEKVERVREVYGIGLLSGCALVASIDADPSRFRKARDAGAYFGLVPRQRQSGDVDEQCHVTKAGSALVRRLMIEAAQMVMRNSSRDTDAKLKGERICARGGRIAKKKALVAVARCLVVTAVALLKKPEAKYVPLSEAARREFEALRTTAA